MRDGVLRGGGDQVLTAESLAGDGAYALEMCAGFVRRGADWGSQCSGNGEK